jgi:peptide/nickel transport system permease protein
MTGDVRYSSMLKQIIYRAVQAVVVLFLVTAVTFILLSAAGGDALSTLRADPQVSERALENMRHVYGLDQPLAVRYGHWLTAASRGNLGDSFYYHAPVSGLLWPRLLNTLILAGLAMATATGVALLFGVWAARREDSFAFKLSELIVLITSATPRIVLALVLLALAAGTSLISSGGASETGTTKPLRYAWLPALVLAAPLIALFLAQLRDGLATSLNEDFVRVARAKGLPERIVVLRHALRSALNPLITIFGYSLGSAIGGSVIAETVLGWPGLGSLIVTAVRARDVPLVMGVVLVTSTAVMLGNLIADILQQINDPRLRTGGRSVVRVTSTSLS